jgi:N-acetyl-gamma-glutamyl-phosphate reductase
MKTIKTCIIGAAGYTGGELLRLLMNHPAVEAISVVSSTQAGKKISDYYTDLLGDSDLTFIPEPDKNSDIYFLCLPHGESKKYLSKYPELLDKKIIDLSKDFRLENNIINGKQFVYGLPELNKDKIQVSQHIANPGCFATAIQLALLPLAQKQELKSHVYVSAVTGSTGAGQLPRDTTHYSWRHSNVSVYDVFNHQHVPEINRNLNSLQKSYSDQLVFVPQRGPFTRGIMATIMLETDLQENTLYELYESYFKDSAFTFITKNLIDLKTVVNTNKCFINLVKKNNQLVIVSVIDNLLKGAAGQAIQNMNLMYRLNETAGLKLKSSTF